MVMTCDGDDVADDDVADDDMSSECSEERSESSVEFVGCGFSEERKRNE
jgi:hypothetical protein